MEEERQTYNREVEVVRQQHDTLEAQFESRLYVIKNRLTVLATYIGVGFEEFDDDPSSLDVEQIVTVIINSVKGKGKRKGRASSKEMETYRSIKRRMQEASSQISNFDQRSEFARKGITTQDVRSLNTSIEREKPESKDKPFKHKTHRVTVLDSRAGDITTDDENSRMAFYSGTEVNPSSSKLAVVSNQKTNEQKQSSLELQQNALSNQSQRTLVNFRDLKTKSDQELLEKHKIKGPLSTLERDKSNFNNKLNQLRLKLSQQD